MTTKLEPGTYRLTQTVKNPHPDKRARHDWRKLVEWPKGSIVKVSRHEDGPKWKRVDGLRNVDEKLLGAVLGDENQQDSITGDVLIQCAIFGDIVYG